MTQVDLTSADSSSKLQNDSVRLKLVYEITRILNENHDLAKTGNAVLSTISEYIGASHATVALVSRETGEIATKHAFGLSPSQLELGKYEVGVGITGQVVLRGEPAVIPIVNKSNQFLNYTNRMGDGDSTFICVPIRVGKEVAGALSVDYTYNPKRDLNQDLYLLTTIAAMIGQAVKTQWIAEEQYLNLTLENKRLRAELKDRFKPSNIIGNSRPMRDLYDQIAHISKSSATVLIHGETGTGKELVAHAIHYNSDRADKPFVKVHCAALAETLIESELFGHEKGSFTGAIATRKGRFELADGGTLFLDEIGDISPTIQIKLLRVLQEREFERVGGTQTLRTSARLIVATNRDLFAMTRQGTFREDLYYRLNVFPIYVPSLKNRRTDITLLADFFLEKYAKQYNKNVKRFSSAAIDMLHSYHWPGNVRELENIIERALLVSENDVIHPYHLPPTLQTGEQTGTSPHGSLKEMIERYEHDIIVDALKSSGGNITKAAQELGSTQRILGYKVRQYKIDPKRYAS